jgi:hypothetical protein
MSRTFFVLQWLMLSSVALSQQALESDLIDLAEARAASFVNIRSTLPDKWSAYIQYQIANAPDARRQDYFKGSELYAEWTSKKAKYGELRYDETNLKNGIEGTSENYLVASVRPERALHFDGNNWTSIKGFPNRDFFDPFALLFSGSSFDFGLNEQNVFLSFFGPTRACLKAYEKEGDLFGVWGKSTPEDSYAWSMTVRFAKKSELPIEVVLARYEKWNPAKLDSPHRVVSKTTIEWQFDRQLEAYVPTHVEATGCMQDDRNREFEFRLEWKFNDDVPDGLFDDPSKQKISKPQFHEKGMVKF